jgi:endonuclease/exonuclease/phosphatase family metal-dependent hydrolase
MKLVQANIWGGRLGNQVIDFLNQEQADLVCLQEVVSTKGDALIFSTLEDIAKATNYPYHFFSPVFDFNLMQKKAGFGNAILSKHPIIKEKTVFTRLEHKKDFDFDLDDYNIRNFQHVEVQIEGKTMHVLNHHGHHVHQHKNGDDETMRQCKLIADYIRALKGPVALTGDFNLAPHSQSLQQINALLDNLSVRFALKTTRTNLTHKKEVCDYIFVNDKLRVLHFTASEEVISDHQALFLEFAL